jgi:peptidoglycan/xylan/chitin deacetylase (PgdA/CDA1 family)
MLIRQIQDADKNSIFLTFDDGPDPRFTPKILELLQRYKIKATFFLIAKKAYTEKELTAEIVLSGHSIGNHSLDHSYLIFFKGRSAIKKWIKEAEDIFSEMKIYNIVGFRPPNGIRTPELFVALKDLNIPLVLWNTRYYDSVWNWTKRKARSSLNKIQPGSIVLLHDVQKSKNLQSFLDTLEYFILEAHRMGFNFEPLTRQLCEGI